MRTSVFSKAVQEKMKGMPAVQKTFTSNAVFDAPVRMGLNENPYGMAPAAKQAFVNAAEHCSCYGNFEVTDLRQALADLYGLKLTNFLIGAGSCQLIQTVGETFLDPEDEVILCPTFSNFYDMTKIFQAKLIKVPLKEDMGYDLEGIRDAVNEHTKMIVITNPNNPTGQYIPYDTLHAFVESLPKDIVVLIDEAYIELATAEDCRTAIPWITEMPDRPVVVSRTFSKYYGMAGVRIGYLIASEEIIRGLGMIPEGFVSREGQLAAIAALHSRDYYEESKKKIVAGARYLETELRKLGCTVWPTQTNFIFFDPHVDPQEVYDRLLAKGILITVQKYDRVTVSTPQNNALFIRTLAVILSEMRSCCSAT